MTVGERIKIRRCELGLSQADLAKKMGYSDKTAVSKAETTGDNITTTKVMKFAKALDCSFDFLMGWEDSQTGVTIEVIEKSMDGMDVNTLKRISLYAQYLMERKQE